jgi:diacylglycerol kinase family enzyme
MPSAVLIANPSASQFTGGGYRRIKAILEGVYELTTEWPIGPHETERLAREAAVRDVDVVFAMGGDGVAHHVANGLVHSPTALGLIPVGTTNVLSRIFDIPQKPAKAAELATRWRPVPTRTVRIAAETANGTIERHATFSVGSASMPTWWRPRRRDRSRRRGSGASTTRRPPSPACSRTGAPSPPISVWSVTATDSTP